MMAVSIKAYCYDEQVYGDLGKVIYEKNIEELNRMLDAGADPNEMQALITPLGIAIEWKRQECIDILLAHPKIDIHKMYTVIHQGGAVDMTIKNALLSAVDNANCKVANTLIDMGANVDFYYKTIYADGRFSSDGTPLTALLYKDKTKEVVELAQRIADNTKEINRLFNYTQYGLSLPDIDLFGKLIGEGNENREVFNDVFISLIDRGVDVKKYFEITSSGNALMEQYLSAAELEAYKKNQKYLYGSSLLAAARVGNAPVLKHMIDKGAPIERYDDGGAVLFSACTNIECVQVMLDCGLDINTRYPSGMPLLLTAVTSENYDLIDGMLKLGADPFIELNGITIKDTMRSYPSSRKKKLIKIYKKYGYEL